MPDPIFAELYRDTEQLTWESMERVRQRGRRRTFGGSLAAGLAGVAAVAAIGTGAVTVAGRPDVSPPVPPGPNALTPSAAPSRTAQPTPTGQPPTTPPGTSATKPPTSGPPPRSVPGSAMLQLADLPDGFETVRPDFGGNKSFWFVTTQFTCDTAPPVWREVGSRRITYVSSTDGVSQQVTRHAGGGATAMMADARQLAEVCTSDRPGDSIEVLAEGLGGADSLLVGAKVDGVEYRWLLVRQGDLVSQLPAHSAGVQISEVEARSMARKVATRLCTATTTC